MKLAIVGSREWKDMNSVIAFVDALPPDTVVISGRARGVDIVAEQRAKARGLTVRTIEPDYELHGSKRAPLIRNQKIADLCDEMVAFWDGWSGGTANAVCHAVALGKPVRVVRP